MNPILIRLVTKWATVSCGCLRVDSGSLHITSNRSIVSRTSSAVIQTRKESVGPGSESEQRKESAGYDSVSTSKIELPTQRGSEILTEVKSCDESNDFILAIDGIKNAEKSFFKWANTKSVERAIEKATRSYGQVNILHFCFKTVKLCEYLVLMESITLYLIALTNMK